MKRKWSEVCGFCKGYPQARCTCAPLDPCAHENHHFDRSICACGRMHHYCDDCGDTLEPCDYDPVGTLEDDKASYVPLCDLVGRGTQAGTQEPDPSPAEATEES